MEEQAIVGQESTPDAATEIEQGVEQRSKRFNWRPFLWLAIGVALCAAAFSGYSWLESAQAAEREQAFQTAMTHFEDAVEELERAQSVLASVKTGPPTAKALKSVSRKAKSSCAEAEAALALADKACSKIEDKQAREKMQEALENARTASKQFTMATRGLPESAPLIKLANEVPDNASAALDALNDTIDLINDERWSDAERRQKYGAMQAKTGLTKAAQMERLRVKLGRQGAGVKFAMEDLRLSKQALIVQAELIKFGRSHSTSAFNTRVKKYNDLMDKGRELSIPDFYDDPKVFLEGQLTSIEQGKASLMFAKTQGDKAKESFLMSERE